MSVFNIKGALNEAILRVASLAEAKMEYYKIAAFEKVVAVLIKVTGITILLGTAFMTIFFASLWLGFFIGEFLPHPSWGFMIVAGLYLFTGLIIYARRYEWIVNPIIRLLAEMFEPIEEGVIDEEEE